MHLWSIQYWQKFRTYTNVRVISLPSRSRIELEWILTKIRYSYKTTTSHLSTGRDFKILLVQWVTATMRRNLVVKATTPRLRELTRTTLIPLVHQWTSVLTVNTLPAFGLKKDMACRCVFDDWNWMVGHQTKKGKRCTKWWLQLFTKDLLEKAIVGRYLLVSWKQLGEPSQERRSAQSIWGIGRGRHLQPRY